MKRFIFFTISSVLLWSLLIPITFGGPPAKASALNAQFIFWPERERVIHPIGTLASPSPYYEGGSIATLGRGTPILFGFEMWDPNIENLRNYKNNANNNMRLKIDGSVVAGNLHPFWQDPFIAQPGIGPKWTWDHDGDGLGDGNGNGVSDWDGPSMFWRFEIRPGLSSGDHLWELEMTDDGTVTWWLFSDGILRIVE